MEESAGMTDADWAKLGNDFMQRMGLMNHQYIIVKHSGTEKNRRQAHLHILANRVSVIGELYQDNWIGKEATEAANCHSQRAELGTVEGHRQSQQGRDKDRLWTASLQGCRDLTLPDSARTWKEWASGKGSSVRVPANLTATM